MTHLLITATVQKKNWKRLKISRLFMAGVSVLGSSGTLGQEKKGDKTEAFLERKKRSQKYEVLKCKKWNRSAFSMRLKQRLHVSQIVLETLAQEKDS
jgi:hypothetical protein